MFVQMNAAASPACFIAYIVQAVVNNLAPFLFVTFQTTYQIPLSKITVLITVNFLIQLVIDALSAGMIDRIGYRASMIAAHIFFGGRPDFPYSSAGAAAGRIRGTSAFCLRLCRRRRSDRGSCQSDHGSMSY